MSMRNRGKALERNIVQANKYYERDGIAVITQMPTPVNITRVQANKATGYLTRSTVDFYGTLIPGQAIYFDAKETNEARFPVANETKLHPHQIDFLDKQMGIGAICFLVVEFTQEREAFLIPWQIVKDYLIAAKNGGRKSIPLKDCRERDDIGAIDTVKGYLDYLGPLLA